MGKVTGENTGGLKEKELYFLKNTGRGKEWKNCLS